jgi:hypothetical protein
MAVGLMTDQHAIRGCDLLQAGSQVDRITQGEIFEMFFWVKIANDNQARIDPNPYMELIQVFFNAEVAVA